MQEFYRQELSIKDRKAAYLMKIYESLVVALNVPSKTLEEIGWSKCSLIAGKANKDNIETLLNNARDMSYADLEENLDNGAAIKGDRPSVETIDIFNPPQSEADKVYKVNLYLQHEQLDVVSKAFEKAKKELSSDKPGYILDMICLHYLSH